MDGSVAKKLGWQHGMRLLKKDNIKVTRSTKLALSRRKMVLNRAITDHVAKSRSESSLMLKEEKEVVAPPWRRAAMNRFGRFY